MGTMQTGSLANVNIGQKRSQAVGVAHYIHLAAVHPLQHYCNSLI